MGFIVRGKIHRVCLENLGVIEIDYMMFRKTSAHFKNPNKTKLY